MADAATCGIHPGQAVIGACQRCGDFVCRQCLLGSRLLCAKCSPGGDASKPDLGVAIGFVFKDPAWLGKLLKGSLWLFLGFIIPIFPMCVLMGYGVRVARREEASPSEGLPEWDNLGDLFTIGIKYYIAQLLPALIVMFALFFLMALIAGAVIAIGAAGSGGGSGGANAAAAVSAILFMVAVIAIIPLSLALGFFMPAIHLHHIRTGRMTAGIEFRELWRIVSSHFSDYLILWVFHLVVQMMAMFGGELMCFVGLFLTIPWMIVTQGYLVGRFAGWLDSEEGPVGAVPI
jgi:hypothetical protein